MSLLLGDIDDAVRKRLDDQDADNPLWGATNRMRAINAAARKVASLIDKADEGYRVVYEDYTSTADQGEYELPESCERLKQVVNLDSDGNEVYPPRTYVPWNFRGKYERNSRVLSVSGSSPSGDAYTYRGPFLLLLPRPTSTASYADVRLYFLPEIPDVPEVDEQNDIDRTLEIPLPKFTKSLLVDYAALDLKTDANEDVGALMVDIQREEGVVTERVTPRTDDGPQRIEDVLGDVSLRG